MNVPYLKCQGCAMKFPRSWIESNKYGAKIKNNLSFCSDVCERVFFARQPAHNKLIVTPYGFIR